MKSFVQITSKILNIQSQVYFDKPGINYKEYSDLTNNRLENIQCNLTNFKKNLRKVYHQLVMRRRAKKILRVKNRRTESRSTSL